MNRLKNSLFYLCGGMDREPDGGVVWRDEVTVWLHELFGIKVFNPASKPPGLQIEDVKMRRHIDELKSAGQYDLIRELYQDVASIDLRAVEKSDAILVYLDMDKHPCGTYNEIFRAIDIKRPVLIVVKQGKVHAPNWLFFRIPHSFIFNDFEEVKAYLSYIDKSEEFNDLKRWRFMGI